MELSELQNLQSPSKRKLETLPAHSPKKLATITKSLPDHTHPLLASAHYKKKLYPKSRVSRGETRIQSRDSLALGTYNFLPRIKRVDCMEQINDFFNSPVYKLLSGPEDSGDQYDGVVMEYYLRKLVGANLKGDLANFIGNEYSSNILIDDAINTIKYNENLEKGIQTDPSHLHNGCIAAWGRTSNQLSFIWDGILTDLYKVPCHSLPQKKEFLNSGIYTNPMQTQKRDSVYYSDKEFTMQLPILKGEDMMSKAQDFDLSYDLHYLIETSGGVDGVRFMFDIIG
jgi:hypothetical protein